MTNEQLKARNTELESNNRILVNELNNKKMELKIVLVENKKLKQKMSDMANDLNAEYCENCGHWFPEEQMKNIANDRVCENCVIDGYGK